MQISIYCAPETACQVLVEDHLKQMGLEYAFEGPHEAQVRLSQEQMDELNAKLSRYGIDLSEKEPNDLVDQIKRAIIDLVYRTENMPSTNISDYLSKKLNYSYGHLTAVFSETTYTSIAHFTIMQKIERAKELLLQNNLTLTEISYQLNYSSVAYLSNQFKMVTGLTPSRFQEIMTKKRRAVAV
jgi:AraC-like DNA-binding protein